MEFKYFRPIRKSGNAMWISIPSELVQVYKLQPGQLMEVNMKLITPSDQEGQKTAI